MEYETSYDTGFRPFVHDKNRGKWESSKDFFYACVGHAFRPDVVTIIPLVVFECIGIYALIPYLAILAVCVVPIVFIQSFVGQFSGTGFISVFRIAPLFKGMGYVSLVVNFVNLTFYSVFSAIPLLYIFHSLKPTIPWSCEGVSEWMDANRTICMSNDFGGNKVPSVEFLRDHFRFTKPYYRMYFSLELMICTVFIWSTVTFVLLKPTELIGRFLRYSCLTFLAILIFCLVRFIFLPGALNGLLEFLKPTQMRNNYETIAFLIPIMALSTLGPGWGSILTMASYNNFKTNIYKYSWLTCLAHLGVILAIACLSIFLKYFMKDIGIRKASSDNGKWTDFMIIPFGLTLMEWPNFWSVLFLSLLVLGSLNLLVIQLFSFLTSLFDEYENLRDSKRNVLFGTVAILSVTSMLFCSNHGVFIFETLSKFLALTQVIMNLLLLLVVLWVYGRERFQRDLYFMTSQTYSTWMVFVVRFVAPVFLVSGLIVGFFLTVYSIIFQGDALDSAIFFLLITIPFFLLLWCLIPCYCVVKVKRTVGNIGVRLKRCVRPTDWYPADPEYRQLYEERFSSTDISHQLTVLSEE